MNIRSAICAIPLALAFTGPASGATQLKQGETACRNHQALLEIKTARAAGDQRTIDWLFGGTVCFTIARDMEIRVLGEDENGNRQLKTINRRRNIELWADARSIAG